MATFSGTVAIRAMKFGDYQATIFAGTVVGLQAAIDFCVANYGGEIRIGPGTIDCGTTTVTIGAGLVGTLIIAGCGERATTLLYSGSGRFIVVGQDDGDHADSADAYSGTVQFRLKDVKLAGPGIASGTTGITDWENGSSRYENVFIDQFQTGYFGIGADVVKFEHCLFSKCGKGAFLASRCDQNTFDTCYFAENTIGANVEYAWGSRFNSCQFVFSTTADIVYDAPASPTEGGDQRLDIASTIVGCWFESLSFPTLARHIHIGTNGTSTRRVEGITIYGGYVLASNTTNVVDVEAGSIVKIDGLYQGGTITGAICNIVSVAGLSPITVVRDCRVNGGTFYGGTVSANSALYHRQRSTSSNAFAASFTPNAQASEIIEIAALTADITINAPTNPVRGIMLTFKFQQDGTGGRTVTWNAVFKHSWSDQGNNVASATATARFYYDGTNWQQMGQQRGWVDTSNRSTLPMRMGANIASAATITLGSGNSFTITGTADITSITATTEDTGRVVWLLFTGTAATNGVVDGSNLKLSANLLYTPDDTLSLLCDGTNWYEVGRSVN